MSGFLKEASLIIKREFSKDRALVIIDKMNNNFISLKKENINEPKEMIKHTHKKIYPAIAFFKALLSENIEKPEAIKLVDESITKIALKNASKMKSLFKIPGLYKLYPKMFSKVTRTTFNEASGFKPEFVIEDNKRCKFNMTKCLFKETLAKYDSLDLLKSFCHTDDINNEGLHKNLIWNRKKAMGYGDDLCDFDIYIKK